MTRDEFASKWLFQVVGLCRYGELTDQTPGAVTKARRDREIFERVEALLKTFYDDLCGHAVSSVAPAANGHMKSPGPKGVKV